MANNVDVVMAGDDARLTKMFQKQVANQEGMERGFRKVKKAADDTSTSVEKTAKSMQNVADEGEETFGSQARGKLMSYVEGFGAMAIVVGVVSSAMQKMRADTDAAMQSIEKLQDQRKEMAQMATDAGDYQVLKKSAERLSKKYGLDQEVAHQLTTAARAGGFEGGLDQAALAAATFATVDDLTATASALPTIFPGLSPEQALNLAAAGGTAAKNMTFKGIAEQVRIGSQGAAPSGSGAVETTALATVLSDQFNMSTGDRIRAFGSRVSQSEFAGKGIMGAFDELQKMKPAQREEFLGKSQELNAVFQFLQKRGGDVRAMEKTLGERMNATGTADSPLMVGARAFLSDEENSAVFGRNVAARRNELQRQGELGVVGFEMDAAKEDVRKMMSQRKVDWVSRAFSEMAMGGLDIFSNDPQKMRAMGVAGSRGPLALGYLWQGGGMKDDQAWVNEQQKASKTLVDEVTGAAKELRGAARDLRGGAASKTGAARREAAANRE